MRGKLRWKSYWKLPVEAEGLEVAANPTWRVSFIHIAASIFIVRESHKM